MIEECSALVTLTIHVTTRIEFSPIERNGPIRDSDFVANAVGMLPYGLEDALVNDGWEIAYPLDGHVHDREDH